MRLVRTLYQMLLMWLLRIVILVKTASGLHFISGSGLDAREAEVLVHGRLPILLLDLRLKDVKFVFHVPINVGKALFRCIIVSMLPFLVCEGWDHAIVELLDLRGWVLAALIRRRTLRSNFSDPHVLNLLLMLLMVQLVLF